MTRAVSLIVVVADRSPRWLYDIHNPFVHLLIFSARKRLVAPIPWGGEEEAQEEASCSESQLLLYGREVSRYSFSTCGLSSSTTVRQFVLIHLSLWGNVLIFNFFFFFFSGCYKITTVFSHAQTVVLCVGCSTVLCQPTGGKARLTEGQYEPTVFILTIWLLVPQRGSLT